MSQQNAGLNQDSVKKVGAYSLADGKIRINYDSGTESVLFEDVSSLSWKSCGHPNYKYYALFLGVILGILLMDTNIALGCAIGFGSIAAALIGAAVNQVKFDNVIIETRGGKIIVFSVDAGNGSSVMSKIEDDKRNHVGK